MSSDRARHWVLYCYLLFFLLLIFDSNADEGELTSTQDTNESFATGKLNQFKGFYTPRPLPANAQFTFASVWASWSAWSFCSNNAQMRVRACNTVRGFNCLGPNRESKPCGTNRDGDQKQHGNSGFNPSVGDKDYEAVDPWVEDRREALKQLFPNQPTIGPPAPRPNPTITKNGPGDFIAAQRSGGRTFQGSPRSSGYGNGHLQGPPRPISAVKNAYDGPPKAPSMTPELLFGSKLEIPDQPINSSEVMDKSVDRNKEALDSLNLATSSVVATSPEPSTPQSVPPTATTAISVLMNQPNSSTIGSPIMVGQSETEEIDQWLATSPSTTAVKEQTTTTKRPETERTRVPETQMLVEVSSNTRLTKNSWAKVSQGGNMERQSASETHTRQNLHSGEVHFPKEDRMSLGTAKALEWMLANMTKAAEQELLLKEQEKLNVVEGGSEVEVQKLHSGEKIFTRVDANGNILLNSGEFSANDNELHRKAFGIRAQAELHKPLKVESLSQFRRKDLQKQLVKQGTKTSAEIRKSEDEAIEKDLLKLRTVMHQIESELRFMQSTSDSPPTNSDTKVKINPKAWDLNLVPTGPPKPVPSNVLTTTAPVDARELTKILLVEDVKKKTEANWSDWQPWGDCFCDRQLRTRVCEYEDAYHSKGCQGRSYESRTCISHKPCPNANHHSLKTTTSQPNTATEQYSFTLAPPKGPRYIYAFRPNPLASAHIEK